MAETAIIGRDEELALLEQRLRSIVDGGSAAVILEGNAGIGKTVLFQSGLRLARERGYGVLSCQPSAAEVQLSYAALGDLLQRVEQQELAVLPPPQRHALEVALRLRDVPSAPSDPRTIALAFLNVLRELSASSPLVIAIDDAQWIDTPTAAVVEFAARRFDPEPLLLLVAFRREPRSEPRLELDQSRLDGRFTRLTIGPLGADELHRLVHQRLGRVLSRPELLRLHEASGGNPFYALELARVLPLAQVGHRSGEPLPVPETLRHLVEARLEALPDPARRVLEVAAALSEPSVALVAAASVGEDEISTALEAAVDASVIELHGDQIRFAHPMLAATAYSRMAPPRRRSLHRRLAALAGDPESRARHLALGTDKPSESVAAAAEHAARHAATRGAPRAAAELCEQAILLTPRARTEARRTRELTLVRYHLASGDVERGRAILGMLRDELPRGPGRAEILLLLGRISIYERQTLQLLEEARAEAAGDTKLLSLIHHALGDEWMGRGDGRRALADLRKALALADECGDRSAVVAAITNLIMAEPSTGRRTPGLFERALALEPGGDDPTLSYSLRSAIALVRLYQGRLDEARALAGKMLADAAALGNELSRLNALRILALIEFRAGEWGPGARHATEACELGLQLGVAQPALAYAKALLDAHLGRVEVAKTAAEEAIVLSEKAGLFHNRIQNAALLGLVELALGHAESADRRFRPLIEELTRAGWAMELHFPSGEPIDALVAVGEHELARDLLGRFEREGRVLASPWIAAAGNRCRGLLLAAEGDLVGAEAAFASALAAQEENGWPFEQARTLLALGAVQRRARHRRTARGSLQAALALFVDLGAPLWAEQARGELARIGGRAAASGELTASEERVAELVAKGRTNKEAAAALYVSQHTIEGHLSRIYAKLGIRSRTELAHRLGGEPRARNTP